MQRLSALKLDDKKVNDDSVKANDELIHLGKEHSEADEVMKKLRNIIENYLQNKFKKEQTRKMEVDPSGMNSPPSLRTSY